ncbi:putative protease [Geothermobacter ehrlichii]|uniref:Putative protease n=1 Tax=Geothermobacter ehrlichii TaxID=213224 RepID=A0A5D3WPG3_9BACT|nr:U32 family peptidase [Geothermobacter ehrlichii]TYP00234.1 putative protease [Geothermobacter ehrlichii]
MKLISPVDNLQEVEALISAGADELYGGVVPAGWLQKYGLLASANQRTFAGAQFRDLQEFLAAVSTCRRAQRPFYLTLNSPFYDEEQYAELMELVEKAAAAGLAGVILADFGLLRTLADAFPELEYHASTLAHLGNSAAVRLYARHGIGRAILPRHLSVKEMAAIVRQVPGMCFDAFLLVGKCPNTEGLCTFHHSSPDKIWPCEIPYEISPLDPTARQSLEPVLERQTSWSRSNRRHGCGLCAIPALKAAGIHGLKLVGRGAPTRLKLANLALACDCLQLAETRGDGAAYRRAAVAAHQKRFGTPCSTNVCYYPEFCRDE